MDVVAALIQRTSQALATRGRPLATYRLQFHKDFTFRDAARITRYLRTLGISDAYASPYLKAAAGSTHGYDGIDPTRLNPEVGTDAEYSEWSAALKKEGMSQVVDTVPNHAGVATNENPWWNDVLMHGTASVYADYFDIAWDNGCRPELDGKVLLPILGAPYGEVLEKGELQLSYERGAFFLNYYERRFPLDPATYCHLLKIDPEHVREALGDRSATLTEYEELIEICGAMTPRAETLPADQIARGMAAMRIQQRLGMLLSHNSARTLVEQFLKRFNGTPGDARSFDLLDAIIGMQAYRLAFWRVGSEEINYRRFFDVNDLAALKMERSDVFDAVHEKLMTLFGEGHLRGFRIDHPDGLRDPAAYLQRLQLKAFLRQARVIANSEKASATVDWTQFEKAAAKELAQRTADERQAGPTFISVEKILGMGETLPTDWPVNGTSGYDFLNYASGLFVDPAGEEALTKIYADFVGSHQTFADAVYENKRLVVTTAFASELRALTHLAERLAQFDRYAQDFTVTQLRSALVELVACFPVYRTYVADGKSSAKDAEVLDRAIAEVTRRASAEGSLLAFLRRAILQQPLRHEHPATYVPREIQQTFAVKFQQLTAPATAKGIEDTTFYRYFRLISLNEVGGDPGTFGISPETLHAYFGERQEKWPFALSSLSTHDTKRAEDVRARVHVLSEMPQAWGEAVAAWRDVNASLNSAASEAGPSANDEYLFYQTLVGAWPIGTRKADKEFIERIQAYMLKAGREAKDRTRWTDPHVAYEEGVKTFVEKVLQSHRFLIAFLPLQQQVAHVGLMNSLAQTLLKFTAPGVPDTYQGTELWDLSLVDPDNRRPVDYAMREKLLSALSERPETRKVDELLKNAANGQIKLYVTQKSLATRCQYPMLFSLGDYRELAIFGPLAKHLFAFARIDGDSTHAAIVVVPRCTASLQRIHALAIDPTAWQGTFIEIPLELRAKTWTHAFTGAASTFAGQLEAAIAFEEFPIALFIA